MIKLSKVSHLLLGVVIGVGLTASAGAYAATTSKVGKRIAGEISVFLNGKEAPSKAIVVDGTSYLPVRWTAEAAGLGLELKDKNVYLTTPTTDTYSAGGEGATDTVPEYTETEKRLQEIEVRLQGYRSLLNGAKAGLSSSRTPEEIQAAESLITDYETKIAELEAERAALEAQ